MRQPSNQQIQKSRFALNTLDYSKLDLKQKKLLNNWGPPSLIKASFFFFITGIYLIIVGVVTLQKNKDIVEISYKYGDACQNQLNQECIQEFEIKEDMSDKPIYFYYEMHQFNQNHKLYLDSYDEEQLVTGKRSGDAKTKCKPYVTNKQIGVIKSVSGVDLDPEAVAIPCGIRAKFYFQDTFTLSQNGQQIPINEQNIAWEFDRKNRFKNYDLDQQWVDLEKDEHFQNWVRPAPLSKFRKLWGRINQNLLKGTYQLKIQNKFDQKYFECEKWVVLSTLSDLGGRNSTLVYGHIIMGVIFIIIGICMLILGLIERKSRPKEE